eukprot:scaffold25830_cov162-Cylindrotheca_fusiformis.AAC.11
MQTSSNDISYLLSQALFASVVFMGCIVMSDNPHQLLLIFLIFWAGSSLLNAIGGLLSIGFRSLAGLFVRNKKDDHSSTRRVSTASQADDSDDCFCDTMEDYTPFILPPQTKRYSENVFTPERGYMNTIAGSMGFQSPKGSSGQIKTGLPEPKRYAENFFTPEKDHNNNTSAGTSIVFQSPRGSSGKKQARLAAIRRAKLAMHADKQKVDALKRKRAM